MATRAGSAQGTSPAAEAWSLMHELLGAYGRPRLMAVASELELSPPQVMALKMLEPGRPVPMRELARALHCDNSNVTGIVDRLEDRGLVERRGADNDRRVKLLEVTPEGEALRARLEELLSRPPEPLAKLSAADQRALRDIMRRALRD
jgi:MarR family transcriptional regulator, organic hydroperoxide resistance regulator